MIKATGVIDHDRLFKELISTFFLEFLDLFLPEVLPYVQEGSLEFLDKEIFTDITAGDRHEVDLVAKLRFKQQDAFFLVHVESQAQPQPNYARRMFAYFSRLHEKHDLPVYPIAVFTFDAPLSEQPGEYRVEFPDQLVLEFRFRTIQLNRLSWRDFARQENPVASALMAKMNIAPGERARVKLECIRLLVSLRLNKAKTHLILGFVDTYLGLSEEENRTYQAELDKLGRAEKEEIMAVGTSWWEEALKKGLVQGREEGLEQGREEGFEQGKERMLSLVTRLIEKRLGPLDAALRERIAKLDADQLDKLGEAHLDFQNIDDLYGWLEKAAK